MDLRTRLAEIQPDNIDALRDLSISHTHLGDLAVATGRPPDALEHFQAVLDRLEDAEEAAVLHQRMAELAAAAGDSERARMHLDAALTHYRQTGNEAAQRGLVEQATVLRVDLDDRALQPDQQQVDVLGGPVVAGVAGAALVAWPEALPGVRAMARALDVSPGGVSLAHKRLLAAGLLTADRQAMPGLFWAVVEAWRPEWIELPLTALAGAAGVVAVGARAAAELGAPVPVAEATPFEFLVANSATLRLAAISSAGLPVQGPMGRFALAPTPSLVSPSEHGELEGFPIAAEATVALTVASQGSRGAETVRAWEGDHVWA